MACQLHTNLQQILGAVWSLLLLQALHNYFDLKKPSITGLNDSCCLEILQESGVDLLERLHRPSARPLAVCLPGKHVTELCSQHGTAMSCNTLTPKEHMLGSCFWTLALHSTPSSKHCPSLQTHPGPFPIFQQITNFFLQTESSR